MHPCFDHEALKPCFPPHPHPHAHTSPRSVSTPLPPPRTHPPTPPVYACGVYVDAAAAKKVLGPRFRGLPVSDLATSQALMDGELCFGGICTHPPSAAAGVWEATLSCLG